MSQSTSPSPETPAVACTLGPSELGTQIERWRKLYADAGTERVATDNGLRVRFRQGTPIERELRALVDVEIECCAWADWTVDEDATHLILDVSSSGDGIPVIQGWFLDEEPVLPTACC